MNPGNFFAELKRRNVYKVAVAYAVIAWLLIQAASILFPTFEAPAWVMKVFVVIVAAGFVVAVVIAWAFEMTPEGIKRTEDVRPDENIPQWSRRKFAALILVIAICAAALLGYQVFRAKSITAGTTESSNVPLKSIAVLPFESLSEDKGNAYFADGIQDEILTRLSKIADLKVISRTSTLRFKSAPADLREIAKQLGVANILEGSVQKANDQVRITVQLINALNDSHLWAETYDRKLIDVFQVETDLAQKIAGALETKLTGKERAAISNRGTENPQAYEAYLRAIALRNAQGDAEQARCRDYLREAVRLDPNFADAWSELTVMESSRFFFPEESDAQKERAHTAAETALRLAPDSPDAQGAMGMYCYYVEKNYDEALRWLDRARAIAPNDWKLIGGTALVKRRQGKLDETIALQKRAAELDPLNVGTWTNLALSYRGRRDLTQARAMFDRALAISPNDTALIGDKAETYVAAGDLDTAWSMLRDLHLSANEGAFGEIIGVLMARRDFAEVERRMNAIEADKLSPLFQAVRHNLMARLKFTRGERQAAVPLLEKAAEELRQLANRREGGLLVLEQLIDAEASLGHRDQVEKIGEEVRARRSFDKWTYPRADEDLARGYAILGDADRAIPLLDRVLHEVCADALTPAYLRFDPSFDPIRNDPRFQKLANEK